jgi:mono/diheme cytochrome c family protein
LGRVHKSGSFAASKETHVLSRTISTLALLLCLGVIAPACDKGKEDPKADPKAKADEKKTEGKGDEKKADADEKKADADEKKADADEKKADADEKKADEAKADEAKADEKKADDTKVEEKKAEEKKVEDKKSDPPKKEDPPKADPGPSADGKDLFGKKCKSCHNSNGDGKTKIGEENDIEDWTVAGWKAKWTEAKVIDIVTNGKSGTKMKPFKDKLTADEIAAVAKYARSLGK